MGVLKNKVIADLAKKEKAERVIKVNQNRFENDEDLAFLKKELSKAYKAIARDEKNIIRDIKYILNYVANSKQNLIVLEIADKNYLFVK